LRLSYLDEIKEQNEQVLERYELAMERVETLLEEDSSSWLLQKENENYYLYFKTVKEFLLNIKKTFDLVASKKIRDLSLEELEELNHKLYHYITGDKKAGTSYEDSFTNPRYAVKMLGKKDGKLLCFLFTELQGLITYTFAQRVFDITIALELFLEIYGYYNEYDEGSYKEAKAAIYYYVSDYSDIRMEQRTRELLDPDFGFATEIIMESDLTDLRYLYLFGDYIGENEIKIAKYLNELSQEEIESMASTYTEGYRKGFENAGIDLSKKSVVNIRYNLGFERMIREAIKQFEKMGLRPTLHCYAVSSIHKNRNLRIGYSSVFPVRQYDYDHRFDNGLYVDKGFIERKLATLRMAFEKYRDLASKHAGPAVLEVFGEVPFAPETKEEAIVLSEKQQKLMVYYNKESGLITNEFIKGDERSFTIIAFPIPEIGDDFEKIFTETVKVNTLDTELYCDIQEKIIDALDQGEYVHVLGTGANKTDIKVALSQLQNPEKETLFENCLADVNIPVGEVFTSPKLTGTNGILHVTKVYLNELEYQNLELTFENGMVKDYTCTNFNVEEENKNFIKENLLAQHESLPLGEFAIGTNTTAYKMARDFNIADKLPILIAEKTGPHFAIGDTCYKMGEDLKLYNPNGKEIVAKDNEHSILRKTDIDKAYFNCHTDITIPYDELGEISVIKADGTRICIIKDGKFVLSGTEELNKSL